MRGTGQMVGMSSHGRVLLIFEGFIMKSKVLHKKAWGNFAYEICTPNSNHKGKFYSCVACTEDGTWTGDSDLMPWSYSVLRHLKLKDSEIPEAVRKLAEWLEEGA